MFHENQESQTYDKSVLATERNTKIPKRINSPLLVIFSTFDLKTTEVKINSIEHKHCIYALKQNYFK